jgi:uncharacterized membrane protein YhhN
LVFIFAGLHIKADINKNYSQIYFFKPLTVIAIILIAFLQESEISQTYKYFILTGLVFSLLGDIFLMLKNAQFTKGLLAFLVAHIFYILALVSNFGFHSNFITLIPVLLFFILFIKIILPLTGTKKIYVIIYSLVIMFLLWQAFSRMYVEPSSSSLFFGVGIILFTISDIILAYNKFVKKFKHSQLIILSTYYIAQLCIAISV